MTPEHKHNVSALYLVVKELTNRNVRSEKCHTSKLNFFFTSLWWTNHVMARLFLYYSKDFWHFDANSYRLPANICAYVTS